jgi:protein HokB
MKLPPSNLLWCVLIVCLTLLDIHLPDQKIACEIRYRDNQGGGGFYGLRIR